MVTAMTRHTTINIRWEGVGGGGRVTKGGVKGDGDGDGNEDGYGDGKKGVTAMARWWRATKRAMAMATRVADEQQQQGRR